MMIRKICITLFAAAGLCQSAQAFDFNPSLSLLANYTTSNDKVFVRSAEFLIQNREVNFGLEFTNKFYLPKNCFIKTGLRVNTYKTTLAGLQETTVPTAQRHLLYWSRGYTGITVPLHFGADFTTKTGHSGDFFIGASGGMLVSNYIKSYTRNHLSNSGDVISSNSPASTLQNPVNPFYTADLGVSYQPFKSYPRFRAGLLYSIQLNQTEPFTYEGTVRNETQGKDFNYNIQHSQRFTNYALTLTYMFGKLRTTPQKDPKDCAE